MVDLRMDDATLIERIEQWRRDGHEIFYKNDTTDAVDEVVITDFPVFGRGTRDDKTLGARVRHVEGHGTIFFIAACRLLSGGPRPAGQVADARPSAKLPIIEELERAATFMEMAEWLCACPLAVFASHGHEIEGVMRSRGFSEGVIYVEWMVANIHAVRSGPFQPIPDDRYSFDFSPIVVDGKHEPAEKIVDSAKLLDRIARRTAVMDLSWHATRQLRKASNAG